MNGKKNKTCSCLGSYTDPAERIGPKVSSAFEDLTILIAGGTGSFGKKMTEILLREYNPKKLIILSRDELKQHQMRQTFPDKKGSPVRYFIGDIRDKDRLYRAFCDVDIVIHAAALKQVPSSPLTARSKSSGRSTGKCSRVQSCRSFRSHQTNLAASNRS